MRRRLIDAAVHQLAAHGMRGLTHRKMEEHAGVAQGSVKYHFGSLDGLIEAVLLHMVQIESAHVMQVSPETIAEAQETGTIPPELWEQAKVAMKAVTANPELTLARFELLLHVARNPRLQGILKDARNELVRKTAASMHGPQPEEGARMVLALIDGVLLHQISAHEPVVDTMAPAFILAASSAALHLPSAPPS